MIKLNEHYEIYRYHMHLILISKDIDLKDQQRIVNFFEEKDRTQDLPIGLRDYFYERFECDKFELLHTNCYTWEIIRR